ncbi:hypothetical protein HanRHA438_Chr16g0756491 [Helianthus annuus]|nr:hypothetical protein HanRHA438_Chr16g0756491 [Helianthus annuus]
MMQTWWIRRWYFLYINVCIILHIVALSKSFLFRHISFYTNNIFFTRHYFYKQLILYKFILLGYTFNLTLYLYVSSELIVFHAIYKTKQITRFMTDCY